MRVVKYRSINALLVLAGARLAHVFVGARLFNLSVRLASEGLIIVAVLACRANTVYVLPVIIPGWIVGGKAFVAELPRPFRL